MPPRSKTLLLYKTELISQTGGRFAERRHSAITAMTHMSPLLFEWFVTTSHSCFTTLWMRRCAVSCCEAKHKLRVERVSVILKSIICLLPMHTVIVFGWTNRAGKATERRERARARGGGNGDGRLKKKVWVRQDGCVSGILSANGLIYHRPRCYGNQHSGQIMGCWSGVFLLIFPFFLFFFPSARVEGTYEFIPSALERRRGLRKLSL